LENLLKINLDNNPVIGDPEEQPILVKITSEDGRQGTFARLPATHDQLYELAHGLLNGIPFTVQDWTGKNRPFSKSEFNRLKNEMIKRKLLEWVNPKFHRSGMQLTRAGWATIRHLARLSKLEPKEITSNQEDQEEPFDEYSDD
jgi:hypothetical protein